jgi:hypothetical protein
VENPCTRTCSGIGGYNLKPETVNIDDTPPENLEK